jgi:hypothetical protein
LDKAAAATLDKLRQNPQFAAAETILRDQQWNDQYHTAAKNLARMAAEAIVPKTDLVKDRHSLVLRFLNTVTHSYGSVSTVAADS